MHCFASENQTYTGTVIFGVESLKSLKGHENLMLENPALKTSDFCHGEHFFVGTEYDIQSTNNIAFKRTVRNFTRIFDFPPSDLMRPRYCHSADARMRMQNAFLFFISARPC